MNRKACVPVFCLQNNSLLHSYWMSVELQRLGFVLWTLFKADRTLHKIYSCLVVVVFLHIAVTSERKSVPHPGYLTSLLLMLLVFLLVWLKWTFVMKIMRQILKIWCLAIFNCDCVAFKSIVFEEWKCSFTWTTMEQGLSSTLYYRVSFFFQIPNKGADLTKKDKPR